MARTDHSRLNIYLSAEEYGLVREIADSRGLSMSAWVRSVILERAREMRGTAPRQEPTSDIDVVGEVEE